MFEVDPERSWVDPGLGPITSLIQSLNTPLVAAGTHPAENVQSWIVTRGGTAGTVEVFVFFHLTESNQAVLYRWDGGPVAGDQQEQVVEEAMGFCESMGFMMDNLNFGQLPPDKRGELLQTLPPFLQDLANLQPRDVDEIPLSISKKVVDPVEEFARARAAMAEAGQATASDFADPNEAGIEFDPSQLMNDVGVAPASMGGEMQIEITEIEGLDLQPAEAPAAAGPAPGRVESSVRELDLDDEPPLVVGAAVTPAAVPSPPVVRGRERTPAGEVTVFDDAATAVGMMPPPAASAPAAAVAAAPASPPTAAEFDVDDLLADVEISQPSTNGSSGASASVSAAADFDVSSALDDILDGVESSKPASPPPAATAVAPADDISLDIDLDSSLEASISSPDEALVALEALGVQDDPAAGMPPPASPNPIPARPAVEAAWATEAGQARANGNGAAHNGAAVRLDISTDELARLLSML